MEDIIGFLILIVTFIISVIASTKKQSGKNKTGEQPLENTSTEPSGDERETESSRLQSSGEDGAQMDSWDEVTDFEETTEESKEEAEERPGREVTPADEKQGERRESTIKAEHAETSPLKETSKRKKRKQKKSKIQEIKEKFDIEEGIIYSEIINRKYF